MGGKTRNAQDVATCLAAVVKDFANPDENAPSAVQQALEQFDVTVRSEDERQIHFDNRTIAYALLLVAERPSHTNENSNYLTNVCEGFHQAMDEACFERENTALYLRALGKPSDEPDENSVLARKLASHARICEQTEPQN